MKKCHSLLILAAFIFFPQLSHAGECVQSRTLGIWTNPFAGHRSDLTKLEIKEICGEETIPHIQVKAYTACAPRDCTWGRAIARSTSDTGLSVRFNTFFAKRTVRVSVNGRRMDATIFDDFHDPRKRDENRSFVLWKE